MPKPSPAGRAKTSLLLHRELRWLEAICGPYELNAYWTGTLLYRSGWYRVEVSRHGIVAGRLMILTWKQEKPVAEPLAPQSTSPPHLVVIKGGKT